MFFWVIRNDDGSSNTTITEEKVLTGIAKLNIAFNQFNIFFKYRGMGDLNKTEHIVWENPGEFATMLNYAKSVGANKPDMFNVYVAREAQGFGGIAESYISTNLGVSGGNVAAGTLIHEVGHCFNLYHLDRGSTNPTNCERVTRDPSDPQFNADEAGDWVVDTPATRLLTINDYSPFTCEYNGTNTDCSNPPRTYEISESDVRNFLMRGSYACEKFYLTPGQGIRMRETIDNDAAFGGQNILSAATTTIASLYEHYKGSYNYIVDNSLDIPHFQPGFDYEFVECDCACPYPVNYHDTSFSYTTHIIKSISKDETDYSTIFHPNHSSIRILHQSLFDVTMNSQPRRCYDNDNASPIGGRVMRFNDGVFSGNVTITHQDSTGINNPTLIDELPSGLYNIEKDFIDGNTEETIIQKEN